MTEIPKERYTVYPDPDSFLLSIYGYNTIL